MRERDRLFGRDRLITMMLKRDRLFEVRYHAESRRWGAFLSEESEIALVLI
jgi:hypothetical protein